MQLHFSFLYSSLIAIRSRLMSITIHLTNILKCGRFNLQVVWGLYANAKNSLYIVHREINPSKTKYHRHSIKHILCKTKDRGLQKLCSKYNKIPFYYYLFLFKTRFFELKSIATLNWSYFKAKFPFAVRGAGQTRVTSSSFEKK